MIDGACEEEYGAERTEGGRCTGQRERDPSSRLQCCMGMC